MVPGAMAWFKTIGEYAALVSRFLLDTDEGGWTQEISLSKYFYIARCELSVNIKNIRSSRLVHQSEVFPSEGLILP